MVSATAVLDDVSAAVLLDVASVLDPSLEAAVGSGPVVGSVPVVADAPVPVSEASSPPHAGMPMTQTVRIAIAVRIAIEANTVCHAFTQPLRGPSLGGRRHPGVRYALAVLRRALVVLLACGCGPSRGDEPPQTCGGDDPVRLIDSGDPLASTSGVAGVGFTDITRVGDRVVTGIIAPGGSDHRILAVDECGGPVVELGDRAEIQREVSGSAGDWAVAGDLESGAMRWLDPRGAAPSHPIFASVRGCPLVVAGGLAAVDAQGVLWFHPDPSDPDAVPREILAGVRIPDEPHFGGDLTDCSGRDGDVPVVDGDGVLVALEGGPLVRVSLPGGDTETLIDEPVREFVVLDDPRTVIWGGGNEFGPCCQINVLDRDTGESRHFAGGTIPADVDWNGPWITSYLLGFDSSEAVTQVYLNAASGVSFEVDDWWNLEASLSPSEMLVSRVGEDVGTYLLDASSQTPVAIDFPRPDWDSPNYDDGVVALDRAPEAETGTLKLLPFDGGPIETLAEDVDRFFVRTRTGTVVYLARADAEAPTGTLVSVGRDGARRELADDVLGFVVPFEGTPRERNEVLYVVYHPERGGLWRFVLP